MYKINKMLVVLLSIIVSLSTNIIVFANSYDTNNKEDILLEKVKIKSIDDYYDYINRVGAVKTETNIGPNNTNDNQDNYNIVNTAKATINNNDIIDGKLLSNGKDIKFSYNDNQGEHYLKGWTALNIATGQRGWYHFDNKGNMSKGFYKEGNNTYYFIENGSNMGMMVTGTLDIDVYIFRYRR